jgi:hypothetical protein
MLMVKEMLALYLRAKNPPGLTSLRRDAVA